eukprot:1449651-Alexandrium_andersonii.AAC.1
MHAAALRAQVVARTGVSERALRVHRRSARAPACAQILVGAKNARGRACLSTNSTHQYDQTGARARGDKCDGART